MAKLLSLYHAELRLVVRATLAAALSLLVSNAFALPQAYWAALSALIIVQLSLGGTLLPASTASWARWPARSPARRSRSSAKFGLAARGDAGAGRRAARLACGGAPELSRGAADGRDRHPGDAQPTLHPSSRRCIVSPRSRSVPSPA